MSLKNTIPIGIFETEIFSHQLKSFAVFNMKSTENISFTH
jgi:hypothetical protein